MKKSLCGFLVFMFVFLMSSDLSSQAEVQSEQVSVLVDSSGQDRINFIMSHVNHDRVPGNDVLIDYVKGANIGKDLNVQEIAKFFDCKTVMGSAFLAESLQKPVSSIDQTGIVESRTNAIKQLVENPELKQQVEEILQNAAAQEKIAMELMSNTFQGQTCPEFQALKKMKEDKDPNYCWVNTLLTNRVWKTGLYAFNIGTLPLMVNGACQNGQLAVLLAQSELDYSRPAMWAVYLSLVSAWSIYSQCREHLKSNKKREKMHGLNQLIHVAESIEELSGEFDIENQFKMSLITDDAGIALVEGLKASCYENEVDYFFNAPAVDTFLYEVYYSDAQLAQIFSSIAEMDAYNAIATKILEGQSSERKFCFAQKIKSDQPQVTSKSFWNVLVPNAVVNSLPMNANIILTGPNAGGKTTSIRANLQNIVLAQTYGIAAAESFEYTPFDVILSYLNISDDLINGYSLFASEINRAKELLEIMRSLYPGQKLFFALDELFTGTAAEQGEKCAYEFIKKTSAFDQALFVYATHFDKLKELGDQGIGLINYKVDAPTKSVDDKLVYPFTLSAGASDVNIALDMAKEANLFD